VILSKLHFFLDKLALTTCAIKLYSQLLNIYQTAFIALADIKIGKTGHKFVVQLCVDK